MQNKKGIGDAPCFFYREKRGLAKGIIILSVLALFVVAIVFFVLFFNENSLNKETSRVIDIDGNIKEATIYNNSVVKISLSDSVNLSNMQTLEFVFYDGENEYSLSETNFISDYEVLSSAIGVEDFSKIIKVEARITYKPFVNNNGNSDDSSGGSSGGISGGLSGGSSSGSSGGTTCIPNCNGKQCSSDGCGKSCGTCDGGFSCISGQCIQTVSNLVNIAPYAAITSVPYTSLLSRLVDDEFGTGVIPEHNDYVENITYEFRFNESVSVSEIRFSLPLTNFKLLEDNIGSGAYNTELTSKNGSEEVKFTIDSPGIISLTWDYDNIDGAIIRFVNNGDILPSPLLFYNTANPATTYFLRHLVGNNYTLYDTRAHALSGSLDGRINLLGPQSGIHMAIITIGYWYVPEWGYVTWKPNVPLNLYGIKLVIPRNSYVYDFQILSESASVNPNLIPSKNLENGVPIVSEEGIVSVATPSVNNQYLKGVYIEPYMFDWYGWITSIPRGNLREWPAYISMVKDLKALKINFVLMMPLRATNDGYYGPVPWPSSYINESSPENYLSSLASALHIDETKLFAMDRPYPGWVPKNGTDPGFGSRPIIYGGVAEMAVSGIDGVAVCYDEYADTTPTSYKLAADAAKAANPNVTTFTNIGNWNLAGIGNTSNIDMMGVAGYFTMEDPFGHWTPALDTARYIGASLKRQAFIIQGNGWTWIPNDANGEAQRNAYPKVSMHGAILSTVFHGGNAQTFWRLYDFLTSNSDYYNATLQGYSMLDTLAAWGGRNASVSGDIIVLDQSTNEAGQDSGWSYYVYTYHQYNNFEPYKEETSRNIASEKAIYELLLTNGYPFQVGYLDYPSTLPNLTKAKVIIIPFAFREDRSPIKQEAINAINQAAMSGTKVILLGYPGTDLSGNNGTVYEGFNDLIKNSNTKVMRENILSGITPEFKNIFLSNLDSALGPDKPIYINKYGKDIEVALLEKDAKDKFLLITNWENRSVAVDVGVNMPEGDYKMLQRDLNEVRNISISGKYIFTKQDLAKFRVNLDAGESKIFYVFPKENLSILQNLIGYVVKSITGFFVK